MIDLEQSTGRLLTQRQVAYRLRLSVWTVARLARVGTFPEVRLTPKTLRYSLQDVIEWVLANKDHVGGWDYGRNAHAEFEQQIRRALGSGWVPGEQLLTRAEAASWLGIHVQTLYLWETKGWLPKVTLKPTRAVRLDASDVIEAIEQRRPQRRGVWLDRPLTALATSGEEGE